MMLLRQQWVQLALAVEPAGLLVGWAGLQAVDEGRCMDMADSMDTDTGKDMGNSVEDNGWEVLGGLESGTFDCRVRAVELWQN